MAEGGSGGYFLLEELSMNFYRIVFILDLNFLGKNVFKRFEKLIYERIHVQVKDKNYTAYFRHRRYY